MQSVKFPKWGALLALVAAMGATRFGHLGTLWAPPDASWAVFFLAGFYLQEDRWVLAVLLCEAIVIDFVAIRVYGVSSYCVTGAYWFIVPGYSMLWLGGAWLRRHVVQRPSDAVRLAGSLLASFTACFVLTEGSFYWLGGRIGQPSVAGWWADFASWYGPFLLVTGTYVGLVAVAHLAVTRWSPARTGLRVR